jgi:hypothetical protein
MEKLEQDPKRHYGNNAINGQTNDVNVDVGMYWKPSSVLQLASSIE